MGQPDIHFIAAVRLFLAQYHTAHPEEHMDGAQPWSQPEWDNNDYSRDFEWLGIPRPQEQQMPVTKDNFEAVFTYHAPDERQIIALKVVRENAKTLASAILTEVPPCADQQAALRLLREAVMTANAAIVLKGLI